MNLREYYARRFPNNLELLAPDFRANDGTTLGDILAEMPVDSGCGDDCKLAVDRAASLVRSVRSAYGNDRPELINGVLIAAIETCVCFIRG